MSADPATPFDPGISTAELVRLMEAKALADFLNLPLPVVCAMSPAERAPWEAKARAFNAFQREMQEGMVEAVRQGMSADDYLREVQASLEREG